MYAHISQLPLETTKLTGTTAVNWEDAAQRVKTSYRDWLRAVRMP